jgi:hypothetical protein
VSAERLIGDGFVAFALELVHKPSHERLEVLHG